MSFILKIRFRDFKKAFADLIRHHIFMKNISLKYFVFFISLCFPVFGFSQTPCQRISIAAYFYPGQLWTQSINAFPKVDFMVMNPASGSGTAPISDYVTTVAQTQQSGIKVYGYVSTRYGTRPATEVQQEIVNYRNWYNVDGIFLDETASDSTNLAYYQQIAAFIRTQSNAKVILNPGVFPDEAYMNVGDVVVVFEGKHKTYISSQVPAWAANYNPNKFWHIVYDAPAFQLQQLIRISKQRRAGHIYITHDRLSNPYDTLPNYWSRLLSEIPQICP
jgi:Spherulation-specific family 4